MWMKDEERTGLEELVPLSTPKVQPPADNGFADNAAALSGPLQPPQDAPFAHPPVDDPAQTAIMSSKSYLPDWKDDPTGRYNTIIAGMRSHSSKAPRNPIKGVFWEYWWTKFVITLAVVFWFCYRKGGDGLFILYSGLCDIRSGTFSKAALILVGLLALLLVIGVSLYATFDRNPKPSKPKKTYSGKPMPMPKAKKTKAKTKKRAVPKPAMQRPQPVMKPTMEPAMALPPDPPDPMDMAPAPDPPPAMRKRRRRKRPTSMRTRRRRRPKPRPMKFHYRDLLK